METYGEVQVKLHLFLVATMDEVKVPRILNGQGSEKAQRQSGHNKSCPSARYKGIWRKGGIHSLNIIFGRRLEVLQNQDYSLVTISTLLWRLKSRSRDENYSSCPWKKCYNLFTSRVIYMNV